MAYLALLWKARTIENYRLKYEKEKINSINSEKAELRSTLYQKWTVYHNDSQKKLGKICSECCPEGSIRANCCTFLKENSSFLLKIVIGMVGGILTYFLYKIFVFQESFWTVLIWVVSVAIILGVAFSYRVRCLVLLLVPGLFSRVGRYTLACYALMLILTGPAANTLKNLDTLSASLACGQGEIKSSVKEIKESKDSPLNLMKETMSATVDKIECLATKMKELMVVIHRLTMSIAHVLQSSLSWLNFVETVCNAKLGTPFEHCAKILAEGAEDSQIKFPEFSSQWDWGLIVQSVCSTLKPGEPLCVVGGFAKGSIVATVKKKLQTYSNRIQSLFNMGVHIRRSHTACSNGSLPVSQAAAGIVTDLRNRADTILAWLSWTCALTGLFLMMIILRAKYYLHMFRTRSRFDNRYVTKELRELDLKRLRQGRETVLPLNTRERAKYVSTASFRLLPSEKMYLTRSIVFMVITTLKLMIHMVADYSLYWVLMSVRFYSSDHTNCQRFSVHNCTARIIVSGSGPLAATVRMLAEALSAPLTRPPTSTNCLPNPNSPDLRRYAQIGTLIFLLWLLALFEPYGLRLRHVISAHYQPERAKARAVWLYYHIIRTRSCFLKYARRKLHRQYKYTSEETLTFKRWLHDCIPCSWLRTLLGVAPAESHCLLCYTRHRQSDLDRHLKRCETPSCPGVYCARCFMDIGQLCTICYSPEDYGDLSDVSLEKFTSDDSEDDDSYDDDNQPLMGARDQKIEQSGTYSNINRRNKRDSLTKRRKDSNEESMPLLDCDYLKEDYTQQGMFHLKYNNNIQKQDDVATCKVIVTGLESKKDFNDKNILDNIIQSKDFSDNDSRFKMFFRDTEVTVNGITFPKGKLGAILRTMLLLTSKDEKYNKCTYDTTMRKPFEYLVMEMFQPSVMLQRIIPSTRNKSATTRSLVSPQAINNPFKSEILYSFNKLQTTESIYNTELQTDFNFNNSESIMKYIQNDSQNKHNAEKISKRYKKLRYSRRKVKRFLDLKKTITNNVRQRISNSRIYHNKYKYTSYNRRRRRNQHFKYLKLISTVSKVFSNKLINYVGFHSLHDTPDLNTEENKPPTTMRKNAKQGNRTLPNQENQARQISECNAACSIKNDVQNLGNIVTGDTHSMRYSDGSRGECPSKETEESNGIEMDNNPEHKTMEIQAQVKKHNKLGFWESLRQRKRRNHSPLLFYGMAKDDSSHNFFINHKTRKKSPISEKSNNDNINARNVKDDVQSYKVSFCVNDVELGGKITSNNYIMNMENNEMPLGPDCKKTEEREPLTKREIKDNPHELCSRWFNEGEINKTEPKTRPVGENQTDKKKCYEVPPASEFVILYDETTNESPGKLVNLSKKLKSAISQIASSLSKRSKGCRSLSFTDVGSKKSKINLSEDEPWEYRVEPNEDLQKDLLRYESKYLDHEIATEEVVNNCLRIPLLHSFIENLQEYKHQENPTQYTETEGDSNRHICVHEWRVEPKTKEKCRTKESNESLKTKKKTKKTRTSTDTSSQSLKNSKRTQMKNTDSFVKKNYTIKRELCCTCKGVKSKGKPKAKGSSDESSSHSLKNKKDKGSKRKPKTKGSSDECSAQSIKNEKHKKPKGKPKTKGGSDEGSTHSIKNKKDKKSKGKPKTKGSSDETSPKNKKKSKKKVISTDTSLQSLENSKKTIKGKVSKKLMDCLCKHKQSKEIKKNPKEKASCTDTSCKSLKNSKRTQMCDAAKKKEPCCKCKDKKSTKKSMINGSSITSLCKKLSSSVSSLSLSLKKKGDSTDTSLQSLGNSKKTHKVNARESKSSDHSLRKQEHCCKCKDKSKKMRSSSDTSLQSLQNSKKKGKASKKRKERRGKSKTPRSVIVKHTEVCLPMDHIAQSSDTETGSTIISAEAPTVMCTTITPQQGRIIKEVTERLHWPMDGICNEAVLEYEDERTPKLKNRRLTLTANRSTATLTRTVADVSTCTSDWWSPLFERKAAQKKTGGFLTNTNMQEDADGVLSASKYLMQSDQYCTQVYSMGMSSSPTPPISFHPRKKNAVTEKPSFKHYHRLHKGKRIKRMIECHSYRKHMQSSTMSLASPKWWPVVTEEQAHALRCYTRRYPKSKFSWKARKFKHETETCEESLTSSYMWTASTFSTSF